MKSETKQELVAVAFLIGIILLMMVLNASGQANLNDVSCQTGVVTWRDAVIFIRAPGHDLTQPEQLLPLTTTFGCLIETENVIVAIHSFTWNGPEDFTLIPKNWSVKIQYLKGVDDDAKPNAYHLPIGWKRASARFLAKH